MLSLRRRNGPELLARRNWENPVPSAQLLGGYGSTWADLHADYDLAWREQLPNSGAECHVDGVRHPFHGDVWAAPWEVRSTSASQVELTCDRLRLPLVVHRTVAVTGTQVEVTETVRNTVGETQRFCWGHHPVFPAGPSTRLELAGGIVHAEDSSELRAAGLADAVTFPWPRYTSEDGSTVDVSRIPDGPVERLLVVSDLQEPRVVIHGLPDDTSVELTWNGDVWPHLWVWVQVAGSGFPWYGRAAVMGVEPQSSPTTGGLAAGIDDGTALVLAPHAELKSHLTLRIF
ncbi:hypothetical protein ACQBAU_04950 [Propionibacteriaceae bacterium Y2011]